MFKSKNKLAILGCGNLGSSIARGLNKSGLVIPKNVYLTTKHPNTLGAFKEMGFPADISNETAVKNSKVLIFAVTPQQLNGLIDEVKDFIDPENHIVISVVTGASIKQIKEHIGKDVPVVRVMPNTAISIQESMSCICAEKKDAGALEYALKIFNELGKTIVIEEELMVPATALCACGTAFFLRAVRAASQGGVEIGFHAEQALFMAAQTAKGASAILLEEGKHPEREVDKVTTPKGITISGLNQMEHNGFSSAMIKGIVTSYEKALDLYKNKE